jgi:hypothetical protein
MFEDDILLLNKRFPELETVLAKKIVVTEYKYTAENNDGKADHCEHAHHKNINQASFIPHVLSFMGDFDTRQV